MDSDSKEGSKADSSRQALRRRIRLSWIGLFTYILIFANAMRFAFGLPYQIFALGQIINIVIITFIVLEIRKDYKKLRNGTDSGA
jgi:uncharacterized membrane protein